MVGAFGAGLPTGFPGGPPVPSFKHRCQASADSSPETTPASRSWRFPLQAAATASGLALAGDTAAQLKTSWDGQGEASPREWSYSHDWKRSLRMGSYGFAIYGPLSQFWYELLDRSLVARSPVNFALKVGLNQVVLGPTVIALVFAWNHLWQNQLSELPAKYRRLAIPTLIAGWIFWIPAAVVNFGVVPLQARVGFMSTCSVFWNFYLSTRAMSK